MRDYIDGRFTPPKRDTSPPWGPQPPCKQALSYTFYVGNVVRVLVHFFSLSLIFTLVATSISHFLTTSNNKCLFCFFSRVLALFLVGLRWPVALLSHLCLFLSLYSKFVDMIILILIIMT